MKKKPYVLQLPDAKTLAQSGDRSWHNGGDIEILLYTRALRKSAQTLIASLDLEPNPKTAWDACPVILLYKHVVELSLKALVGEGSNFLPSPIDPITLYKTHSLRWLAQIVCQIIKAVRWEDEFKCEGVASLADFSALVSELEALDPVTTAVHSAGRDGSVPPQLQPPNVVQFARRVEALVELLDATADALAATWDLQVSGEDDLPVAEGFSPTIQ